MFNLLLTVASAGYVMAASDHLGSKEVNALVLPQIVANVPGREEEEQNL